MSTVINLLLYNMDRETYHMQPALSKTRRTYIDGKCHHLHFEMGSSLEMCVIRILALRSPHVYPVYIFYVFVRTPYYEMYE